MAQRQGLCIALLIIGLWVWHLALILNIRIFAIAPPIWVGLILVQTFLNTGLFITAHDAIHGLVYPRHRRINHGIGVICSLAYAALSYPTLRRKHGLHHRYPTSAADPDFCGQSHAGFLTCYRHFMGQYWGWQSFVSLATAVAGVAVIFRLSPLNLALFWAIPLLLSSLQLFYFGTYRPHQQYATVQGQVGCSPSHGLPWLWSLLLCYHFGYHQEHHDHPEVPWWQLPAVYSRRQSV
ncbi:MAG: beta-carotene ketolase [Leptolyngbya sp. RL_3_1]|nr:beta-carotene ketolase [Leptolyngbya sp. RL_3_1]